MTLSLLAHALALVAQPRMGLFDSLPGFWKVACPPGYARASHCLFLGTDDAAKQKAAAVLERVQSGSLTLAAAARQRARHARPRPQTCSCRAWSREQRLSPAALL